MGFQESNAAATRDVQVSDLKEHSLFPNILIFKSFFVDICQQLLCGKTFCFGNVIK